MNIRIPKIVRTTASITVQREYGQVPHIIGIGPTKITVPDAKGSPEKIVVITTNSVPVNINERPKRNSFEGSGHVNLFNA